MSLIPSFSINAIPQADPSAIFLTDTSSGTDSNIDHRQILIYKVDNSLYTAAQNWSYASPTTTLNVLTQDIALNIVVNWMSSLNVPLYTSSQIYAFRGYSKLFLYQLTQTETSQPLIVGDNNFYAPW